MAKPFMCVSSGDLSHSKVTQLLQEADKELICQIPPAMPKSGEVYVYEPLNDNSKNDWKCDQYRWCHYGSKKLKVIPPITKSYYVLVRPDGQNDERFKRFSYRNNLSETNRVVIHYRGDNSAITDIDPHVRTCPSVLRNLEETEVPPSVVYKKNISKSVSSIENQCVMLPRNCKQVKNLQSRSRQRLRLTHDALYNLHELAYDMQNFVLKIITFPDLIIICGLKELTREVNRLLQLDSPGQLLSYDTTFKLGDFYVSPFLFRNILFDRAPVMPALFMLHKRKLSTTHSEMMRFVASELPCLANGKKAIPMVTDDEKGFEVFNNFLPKVHHLLCWNHLLSTAKRWLKSHGASAAEIQSYIDNLRTLFHQETEEKYHHCLKELKTKWSQPFLQYFMTDFHKKVLQSIGRWNLELYGVYNPVSGITTNQLEGFNSVLKRLQGWKEIPVDTAVLSLYYLQVYYWNEWQRGLADFGEFKLKKQFSGIHIPPDEVNLISTTSLEEIIKSLKNGVPISSMVKGAKSQTSLGSPKSNDDEYHGDCGESVTRENDCSSLPIYHCHHQARDKNSQIMRARLLIHNGCVSHDPKLGTFTVLGSGGKPHVVRLFPSEDCSCPSTSTCYHQIAVKLSLGIPIAQKKKTINLTQLRRNTRAKSQKRSGRKRPRQGDYDVVPAPDSISTTQVDNATLTTDDEIDSHSVANAKVRRTNNSEKEIIDNVFGKPCQERSGWKRPKQGDYDVVPAPDSISTTQVDNATLTTDDEIDSHSVANAKVRQTNKSEKAVSVKASIPSKLKAKRKRCGECDGCTASDCGKCSHCRDMAKFGGRGLLKQCCVHRKCKSMKPMDTERISSIIATQESNMDIKLKRENVESQEIEIGEEVLVEEKIELETNGKRKKVEISEVSSKDTDVLLTIKGIQVCANDLSTLSGTNWLNDKIIDAYMFMLEEEANKENAKVACCVSCFFYNKLHASGFKDVKNWIKEDAFSFDKLLIPVCSNNHWCLAVVDFFKKELRWYDSLGAGNKSRLKIILEFLMYKWPDLVQSTWKMHCPNAIPLQQNSHDCGVFLCKFARCEVLNHPINFTQENIPQTRALMKAEILGKKLFH